MPQGGAPVTPVDKSGNVIGGGTGATATQSQGTAASDAVAVGNPVRTGATARTSNITAVANADAVDNVATTVGAQIVRPFSIPELDWQYAAPVGGISNTTTAATLKAAAGAGIRNYITALQISANTLGGATEIAIRDGAGGTVIWRGQLTTAGTTGVEMISFGTPLKGTANTLLEVVTLTAVTGNVYVNAQGYAAP